MGTRATQCRFNCLEPPTEKNFFKVPLSLYLGSESWLLHVATVGKLLLAFPLCGADSRASCTWSKRCSIITKYFGKVVWTYASDVLGARDEKHPAICHDVSHYVCCYCHIASGCNIKLTAVGVRIKHSDSTNAACLVAMPIPRGAYRVCDGQTASCILVNSNSFIPCRDL